MGGIGTYVVNMAAVLLDAGHKVTVVTKWHPDVGKHVGFADPEIRHGGRLNIIYLPFADEEWNLDPRCSGPEVEALASRDIVAAFGYSLANGLLRLVDASDIDIIEAPEYEYPAYYYQLLRHAQDAPLDARSRHVPVIVHLHSPSLSIFRENEEYIATPWQRFRCLHEKASIRYADAVLSPSAFLADEVAEWADLPRDTVQVIPYPLGQALVVPESPPVAQNRFLLVGRIEPRKGVFEYTEAAVRHARKHPTAEFRFIGGPHVRSEIGDGRPTQAVVEEFIPKAVRSQFRFMGKVPREHLATEYANAGFCVVPSRWDNYPNICMEPMSLGRPVLVSDRGGQAELVEDGVSGIVARAGHTPGELVEALAGGLEQAHAMDASTRATMGQAARDRVACVCDNAAVLASHLDFYKRVCAAAGREQLSGERPQLIAGIFARKGQTRALARTLESLPHPPVTRCLVATPRALPGATSEHLRLFHLSAEDRLPRSGIRKGWWTRTIQGEAREDRNTYVLFLAPGTQVLDGFLAAALRVMEAQPRVAFCTCWAKCKSRSLAWMGGEVDDAALLQDWEPLPSCGLLRWSAVRTVGGLEGRGILFCDVIRGLQVRLIKAGHACLGLPILALDNLVETRYATLGSFGFHSEVDSRVETDPEGEGPLELRPRSMRVAVWRSLRKMKLFNGLSL